MIIDNPEVMRDVIQTTGACFTHPGAEEVYTVRKSEMDAYAAGWGKLADRIWEEEYQGGNAVPEMRKSYAVRQGIPPASDPLRKPLAMTDDQDFPECSN